MKLDFLDVLPICDDMFMSQRMSWYVCTEGQEPPQDCRRQEGGVTFHTEDSQILSAAVQNSAARTIRRPGCVYLR